MINIESKGPVYLDYAATAPMRPEVLPMMQSALEDVFGNASTVYQIGAIAKDTLESARETIARCIGAKPAEVFFTSGGTESDNWALIAGAESGGPKGHILTTEVEHHAVLHTCDYLRARGYDVTVVKPDEEGVISADAVCGALREDTVLVSVMMANNEIGTIEPVKEIASAVKAVNPSILVHTDAVQAFGKIPIDTKDLGIDLMSASAHKIGGPKGIGFLYIRSGVQIGALIHGGNQERGRRAGTENVPAAEGFAWASKLAVSEMEMEGKRLARLSKKFLEKLKKQLPDVEINGPKKVPSLPGYLNLYFPGVKAETLLIRLDLQGFCCSAGSACTTGALDPSHVLTAIGCSKERAESSLRITMGRGTTQKELDDFTNVLVESCNRFH